MLYDIKQLHFPYWQNARASYDFSSNDPFPYPRYTDDWFNSHGTRCAGEISAKRDNGVCGVGVAYDSLVAGIRMLDQPYMTDLIEANSMGHEPDLIDIYSASWGPTDDGKTVDGPRNATMRAIVRGVNEVSFEPSHQKVSALMLPVLGTTRVGKHLCLGLWWWGWRRRL